jgi:hypothetical protein
MKYLSILMIGVLACGCVSKHGAERDVAAFSREEGFRLTELRTVLEEAILKLRTKMSIPDIPPNAIWTLSMSKSGRPMLTLSHWVIDRDKADPDKIIGATPPFGQSSHHELLDLKSGFVEILDSRGDVPIA